jgi:hypothetical protein
LVNAWSEVRKALPKITAFKARHRSLYRWRDSDFDKYGKVPDVDQAVSTFISSGQSSKRIFETIPSLLKQNFTQEICRKRTLVYLLIKHLEVNKGLSLMYYAC